LGGALVLFQTKALWDMDSPNACAWNATMNGTATVFSTDGIFMIFIVIIVAAIIAGITSTFRGYG